jgi:2-succinyl-6-hydroxy-2,4-cyclohexadiene-1-carboxylate synthase
MMSIDQMAPTLVLLHGFTNTGASWDPVIAALDGRYRAIAPDIRGHGAMSDSEPVTLEAVIDDVGRLTRAERFTLCGYSMGGRIALHVALAMPSRIERLILIGASPGLADPAERAARRASDHRLADEIESSTIEEFAERWAKNPVLTGQPASARSDRLRNSTAGLGRALRGLGTGALPSVWQRLAEVRIPVTLIVGERDEKFRAIASRMAGELPHGEVVVIPDAGHAPHLEAPALVARAI